MPIGPLVVLLALVIPAGFSQPVISSKDAATKTMQVVGDQRNSTSNFRNFQLPTVKVGA